MKEHKNIEKLFKDSFDGFEADPGANAWSNIQSQIGVSASASASAGNTGVWAAIGSKILTAVVGLGIVGLSIGGYYFFDSKGVKNKEARENLKTVTQPESNTKQEKAILETETEKEGILEKEESVPPIETEEADLKTVEPEKPVKVLTNSTSNEDLQNESEKKTKEENNTEQVAPVSNELVGNSDDINSIEEENNDQLINGSDVIEVKTTNQNIEDKPSTATDKIAVETPSKNEVITPTKENIITEPDYSTVVNAFTPNGDGTNDMFEVKLENVDELEVIILDKTGKEIHNWIGQYGFWDGKRPDNSLAPEGPYFYIISSKKEGKTFTKKGSIILKR